MTRKIIHISLSGLAIAVVIFLLAFTNKLYDNSPISNLNINIDYPVNQNFSNTLITKSDIYKYIYLNFDSLESKKTDSVNIEKIESILSKHEFIQNADVSLSILGNINIKAKQREPIIRIVEEDNTSYYIDKESKIIPLRYGYPCQITVCNGFIRTYSINKNNIRTKHILEDSLLINSKLKEIYNLALKIYNDDFLNSQISQIFIQENGEFELVPIVGDHIIILGNIDNIDNKLVNLKAFYTKVIKKGGWDNYKSINLKYDNQIVCTKLF